MARAKASTVPAAMDGQANGIIRLRKMRASDQPRVRAASIMRPSSDSNAPSAVRYTSGKLTTTADITAACQVKTRDTPCAISQRPTPVDRPKSMSRRKPHTVGGSTMGMVNTESSTPLRRLDAPMTRHAAKSPSAKEIARASPLVLIDTQNGR